METIRDFKLQHRRA